MLGSVLLQVVSWALGTAAAREGLSTSLLSRWAGLGKIGSAVLGGVVAISMVGWFGVQNSVFAEGMFDITGVLNYPVWALITGLGITVLVVAGYQLDRSLRCRVRASVHCRRRGLPRSCCRITASSSS